MLRFVIIPFFLVLSLTTSLFADLTQNQMVSTSTQIIKIFNQDFNGTNPHYKLPKRFHRDRIKAVAIIPDLVKSGLLLTAHKGEGIFCIKNADGTWSNPLFVKVTGLGVGAQAGYQSSDAVLLFDNRRSYTGLFDGTDTIDIGGDASVLGGATSSHLTDVPKIAANVLAIGRSNGIFIGLSLDGSRLVVSDQNNIDYYGRMYKYEDIVNGSPKSSKYTKALKKALDMTFSPKK